MAIGSEEVPEKEESGEDSKVPEDSSGTVPKTFITEAGSSILSVSSCEEEPGENADASSVSEDKSSIPEILPSASFVRRSSPVDSQ